MKYKLITFLLIVTFCLNSNAQWKQIKSHGSNYGISCFATNALTCFIPSKNGYILRTLNGGNSWDSSQTTFVTSYFNDIFFPSNNVGYACGGGPFSDHRSCIAKTVNAGQTWDSITSNAFNIEFKKIYFINDSIGYVGGRENLIKTINGGKTLNKINLPFSFLDIEAIHFVHKDTGVIGTLERLGASNYKYRIAKTTDGGLNWATTFADSASSSFSSITHIAFWDNKKGIAVRRNGTILSTLDQGVTWSTLQLNNIISIADINLVKNSLIGYMAVERKDSLKNKGWIYKTIDGGKTWQENSNVALTKLSMLTESIGFAVSGDKIYKTLTGGGIVDIASMASMKGANLVFPNPNSGIFNFAIKEINEVYIYNSMGEEIYFSSKNWLVTDNRVDISKYPKGVYYIKILGNKNNYFQKFIVQ